MSAEENAGEPARDRALRAGSEGVAPRDPHATFAPDQAPPVPAGSAPAPRVDRFVVLFALSVVGGGLLTLVLAYLARRRARARGTGGERLAMAAMALSSLWIALTPVLVHHYFQPPPAPSGPSLSDTAGGLLLVLHASPAGACAADTDPANPLSAVVVACAIAHRAEVVGAYDLPAGPYPGTASMDSEAEGDA
jgi:hypothetical protein